MAYAFNQLQPKAEASGTCGSEGCVGYDWVEIEPYNTGDYKVAWEGYENIPMSRWIDITPPNPARGLLSLMVDVSLKIEIGFEKGFHEYTLQRREQWGQWIVNRDGKMSKHPIVSEPIRRRNFYRSAIKSDNTTCWRPRARGCVAGQCYPTPLPGNGSYPWIILP